MLLHIPLHHLDAREVWRYAGQTEVSETLQKLYAQCVTQALALLQPIATWQTFAYDPAAATLRRDNATLSLSGCSITRHLAACQRVTVLCVTIGAALEEAAHDAFQAGAYGRGLLLDSAGSAAVEQAADYANSIIDAQARRKGWQTTPRFSPGYGDWDLASQLELVRWGDGHNIGLTVTTAHMLQPRKSITAVIGWQRNVAAAQSQGCAACNMADCRLRRASQQKEKQR